MSITVPTETVQCLSFTGAHAPATGIPTRNKTYTYKKSGRKRHTLLGMKQKTCDTFSTRQAGQMQLHMALEVAVEGIGGTRAALHLGLHEALFCGGHV